MSENSRRISGLIKKLLVMNRDDAATKHEDQLDGETTARESARKRIRQKLVQVLNIRDGDRPQ